jgi:hypothetical protein
VVEEDIVSERDLYHVMEVAYDPWQATQLAQNLTARGFDGHEDHGSGPKMVEVRATTQNYSAPMKEIEALVRSGRFHHDGNPVLAVDGFQRRLLHGREGEHLPAQGAAGEQDRWCGGDDHRDESGNVDR